MEEVGRPREGQEEDPRSHRRHPHPKGEQPEGVGCHQGLPHKEGGIVDDAHAPVIRDGAQGVVRWNNSHRGGAPQLEPSWDDMCAPLDFIFSVPGHPPMRPESGYVIFVSFPLSCLLFN